MGDLTVLSGFAAFLFLTAVIGFVAGFLFILKWIDKPGMSILLAIWVLLPLWMFYGWAFSQIAGGSSFRTINVVVAGVSLTLFACAASLAAEWLARRIEDRLTVGVRGGVRALVIICGRALVLVWASVCISMAMGVTKSLAAYLGVAHYTLSPAAQALVDRVTSGKAADHIEAAAACERALVRVRQLAGDRLMIDARFPVFLRGYVVRLPDGMAIPAAAGDIEYSKSLTNRDMPVSVHQMRFSDGVGPGCSIVVPAADSLGTFAKEFLPLRDAIQLLERRAREFEFLETQEKDRPDSRLGFALIAVADGLAFRSLSMEPADDNAARLDSIVAWTQLILTLVLFSIVLMRRDHTQRVE